MAVKLSANNKSAINVAMNRALISAGAVDNVLGQPFTDLIDSGSGGYVASNTLVTGSSYTALSSDFVILMNDDAARTLSLPQSPAGQWYIVVDDSGSTTAGHTITISTTAGVLWVAGATASSLVITPGTTSTVSVMSDGTNFYLMSRS
jgi:hypothetical protein